ncbi:hypothetical protein AMD27_07975 [Acinetobacter sp. TGL-Y2]|uniref:hypothetical protein n=1 Tax=Acinetobacter sp. TGL-Y2 TaxID=1407071 RepID=UPI0007A651BB|nr:hypothetical protein [Acinetobacter sp. TGL-Y2]AMW78822.1 hypothetical protein AMD27_07975 [Acinetobacter sp. TGL-Y2]
MNLNLKKSENYNAVLSELSPFRYKYFLFVVGFFILFLSIQIPFNEYYGITLVGQSDKLDIPHRLLFDTLNILIIITNIYLLAFYKIKGFSSQLVRELTEYGRNYIAIKQPKYSFSKFFSIIFVFYFIFLIAIFSIQPNAHSRFGWFYHSYIYFSFIYAFFIYYVFTVFFAAILAMNEIRRYFK